MAARGVNGEPAFARIAHLSDLHCDASAAWVRGFQTVRELLVEKRPDAILITGDCANHPKKRYYRTLKDQLTGLKHDLEATGKSVPVVAIPGNHDYSFFGTRILAPLNIHPVRNGLEEFLAGRAFRTDLARLALEHRIVVFPFDSNRVSFFGARSRSCRGTA